MVNEQQVVCCLGEETRKKMRIAISAYRSVSSQLEGEKRIIKTEWVGGGEISCLGVERGVCEKERSLTTDILRRNFIGSRERGRKGKIKVWGKSAKTAQQGQDLAQRNRALWSGKVLQGKILLPVRFLS